MGNAFASSAGNGKSASVTSTASAAPGPGETPRHHRRHTITFRDTRTGDLIAERQVPSLVVTFVGLSQEVPRTRFLSRILKDTDLLT